MPTEKEKIALKLIYNQYKIEKNSDMIYIGTEDLLCKSANSLTLPDLHALILHGKSQYIGFHGTGDSMVKILPAGISYMEGRCLRLINSLAFWVFGLSSVVAALYAILTYYFK